MWETAILINMEGSISYGVIVPWTNYYELVNYCFNEMTKIPIGIFFLFFLELLYLWFVVFYWMFREDFKFLWSVDI